MKAPFALKDTFHKSMFIRCFHCVQSTYEQPSPSLSIAHLTNGSFLHLKRVFLKDFYVSANRVLTIHFAKNDISWLQLALSRTIVKYRFPENSFEKSLFFSLFLTSRLLARNQGQGSLSKVLYSPLDCLKGMRFIPVPMLLRSLFKSVSNNSLTFSNFTLTLQVQLEVLA